MNVVFIIRFLLLSIAVFANGYLCYKEPLWWLAGLFSDLAQPLKDLLSAMIERYRAKTEAIKKKNKEAQQ